MPSKSVPWMQDNGRGPGFVHLDRQVPIAWTPTEVSTVQVHPGVGRVEPSQVVVGT